MHQPKRIGQLSLALLTLVVWMGTTGLVGALLRPRAQVSLPDLIRALGSGLVVSVLIGLLVLAVATILFRWTEIGFRRPDMRAVVRLMWFPLLTLAPFPLLAWAIGLPPPRAIGFLALNTLFIALAEEWMFRGILFHALAARFRLWPAVLITSVLFGAAHVMNVFAFGDLRLALVQSLAAMMTGILLAALVVRTGSIWSAVAYHMAWNFGILLLAYDSDQILPPDQPLSLGSYLVPMLIVLPNLLFALILLHRGRRDWERARGLVDES